MKFYIIVFLLFCAGNLAAQNNIESILRSIEKNNKELQASEQLTLSKKLEAATENTLPDPNVSYERKWGKPASIGKTGELSVSQSFDFPSVYVHKNQLYDLKSDLYDQQKQIIRQQVLLNAKNNLSRSGFSLSTTKVTEPQASECTETLGPVSETVIYR